MRLTRSQTLELDPGSQRAYGMRFSNWPYPLREAALESTPAERKVEIVRPFYAVDFNELDIYSESIRRLHPTVDDLLRPENLSKVLADLDAVPLSIDELERMNSQLTNGLVKRAPGRSLILASREHFLHQANMCWRM